MGVSTEDSVLIVKESSRDGIDSTDTVRVERGDPIDTSSISESSGALSNMSIGLRPDDKLLLNSFSECCDCAIIDSTVILFSECARRCRCAFEPLLGRGMLVTARSAATDAGMASGE
jgi:hypothetical protein